MTETYSIVVQTEQQELEQQEHCLVQEEQASRSHWEHRVSAPWLFRHTQQPVGPPNGPKHKTPQIRNSLHR